jgi:hypothetical protein
MQLSTDLAKGLEIIEPFLTEHGFEFHNYEKVHNSGRLITEAIFKNTDKKFIIGYNYTVERVAYQDNKSVISHHFYLDKLGYADLKRFPDFQLDDKILSFKNILLDFDYLTDDFFNGSCIHLNEFAELRDELIKSQDEFEIKFDTIKIEQARKKFRRKEWEISLEIYQSVVHKDFFNYLDKKIIEYCEHKI